MKYINPASDSLWHESHTSEWKSSKVKVLSFSSLMERKYNEDWNKIVEWQKLLQLGQWWVTKGTVPLQGSELFWQFYSSRWYLQSQLRTDFIQLYQ